MTLKRLKIEDLDQKREGRKRKQPGGRLRRRTAGDLGAGVGTERGGCQPWEEKQVIWDGIWKQIPRSTLHPG